jgi:hypothetical protein
MAITKKHQEVQVAKALIRDQIEAAYEAGLAASAKVPDAVLNGRSHAAVSWKAAAALFQEPMCPRGPVSATVAELSALLSMLKQQVERLCGNEPFPQSQFTHTTSAQDSTQQRLWS